jgi:hypothetical protein
MPPTPTRRTFLRLAACGAASAAWPVGASAAERKAAPVPAKRVIAGKPRDRGRAYGTAFKDGIAHFLEKEIYGSFVGKPSPKDRMLRYAVACGAVVREVCPVVFQELEGVADGSGRELDEVLLITLHEELYHRGALPKVPHCTAVAVGPPDTAGPTFVGQTWDWMESVAGMSSVVEWRTGDGPAVLAYGFPGLWAGAGLNSNGVALCWTSADLGNHALGARVGVPSYALIAHLLYQNDLDAALKEVARDRHAGWFAFVLADGEGRIAAVEGSPKGVHVERTAGHAFRVGFASRQMTGTPDGKPVALHPRCVKMAEHVKSAGGKVDRAAMQDYFAKPANGISVGPATIDMMVFDCTARTAHLSRGPSYGTDWKEFGFGGAK